jgi:hypothetical protein
MDIGRVLKESERKARKESKGVKSGQIEIDEVERGRKRVGSGSDCSLRSKRGEEKQRMKFSKLWVYQTRRELS